MTRKEQSEFVFSFSTTESRPESMKSRSEPGFGLVLRLENFVMTGVCSSSKEVRVVLVESLRCKRIGDESR